MLRCTGNRWWWVHFYMGKVDLKCFWYCCQEREKEVVEGSEWELLKRPWDMRGLIPQGTATEPLVQPPKCTDVIFVKAVPKKGCHVVCFVHGIYLYQVICEDAGYQSLELWGNVNFSGINWGLWRRCMQLWFPRGMGSEGEFRKFHPELNHQHYTYITHYTKQGLWLQVTETRVGRIWAVWTRVYWGPESLNLNWNTIDTEALLVVSP